MIKEALFHLLTGDSGIAALVDDRVYPEVIPQKNFDETSKQPCVVFRRAGAARGTTRCATDALTNSDFVVTSFAMEYEAAEQVAEVVRVALLDFEGTVEGVRIRTIKLENEFDGLDIEPGLYRVDQFWTIWHDAP